MSIGLIGLKEKLKYAKGCYFTHKIKIILYEIKYAWQRAWRGYDDVEVFNYFDSFVKRNIEILQQFKKNNIGSFSTGKADRLFYTEVETDKIIEDMINHLKFMDEDYVEKALYGKNIYDDDYDVKEYTIERCKLISSAIDKNKDEFFKLFNDNFYNLWY